MSQDGDVEIKVPNLGDFKDVAVIDVLVKAGDTVAVDTPLVTLESDKAALDVPSPAAGVVVEVTVRTGDRVNTGSLIARLRSSAAATPDAGTPSRKDETAPHGAASSTQAASGRDDTAPHQALRKPEPYGGEPYMDTVPIAPIEAAR